MISSCPSITTCDLAGIVDPSHRAEGLGLRMKDGMDDLSPEEVSRAPGTPSRSFEQQRGQGETETETEKRTERKDRDGKGGRLEGA